MIIAIPDDYQNCVRTLNCFKKTKGHSVRIFQDHILGINELVNRFYDVEAIVLTRERTPLNRELLSRLPNLKIVSQTGKISSHVDIAACKEFGITVTDGSGSGNATAELGILLILASLRNLVQEVNRLQGGNWQGTLGRQLNKKVLGVYGYGRIGQQICSIGQSFGANILVWGRESSLTKAAKDGFSVAKSKSDFFRSCDIISLQIRLTSDTKAIVTADDLALMKQDAILVNTSRAELIQINALENALKAGRPGFAAIDVFESDPILGANHPLLKLNNCLCTPHLGFVEKDNYEMYFGLAFDNINAFATGKPINVIV